MKKIEKLNTVIAQARTVLQFVYFLHCHTAISNFFFLWKNPSDRPRDDEASASCADYAAAPRESKVLLAKKQYIWYMYELEM